MIRGKIKGSIYTPRAKKEFDCYLPGRFDARAMHISEKVPLKDPALHQLLPRYDRTIGHLGYRYDPTKLKCRMIYFGPLGDPDTGPIKPTSASWQWAWGMRCVWPAVENPRWPFYEYRPPGRHPFYEDWKWGVDSLDHPSPIDGFLPVIFNEYAEITPINPHGSERTELPAMPEDPHQPTHYYIGNIAYTRYLQPEPGDIKFPSADKEVGPVGSRSIWVFHDGDYPVRGAWKGKLEDMPPVRANLSSGQIEEGTGYWLDAGPGVYVPPLRDFTHHTYILTQNYGELSVLLYDDKSTNSNPSVGTYNVGGYKLDNRHFRPFEPGKPWPIGDVVFAWDVRYIYYGRSRQQPSGYVPIRRNVRMMRSPVTLSIFRFDHYWNMIGEVWMEPGGDAPSIMMLDNPW
jgi:hypothetical protein